MRRRISRRNQLPFPGSCNIFLRIHLRRPRSYNQRHYRHANDAAFLIVLDGVAHQIVYHLLRQRFVALHGNGRAKMLLNLNSTLFSRRRKPGAHAPRHRRKINGKQGGIHALVKARKREYVIDQAPHRLGLLTNKPRKTRHVRCIYHAAFHELRVTANHLQGRLHFVAYVAGEFATRENGTLKLGILPLKLTSLQINALKQRLNFLVRIVFQGVCHINVAKRPRDGLGQTARHQKRQNENDHQRSSKRQRHTSQE